ncbi:MAG: polyphosphate kinase 1 [Blastocatellia bacterium]
MEPTVEGRSSTRPAGSVSASLGILVGGDRRSSGAPPEGAYFNRELSWIEFNSRVLEEALDPTQPLLERLKFLAIFSDNLDEFFMVRVSGLQEQLEADPTLLSPDGLTPATQLRMIGERLRTLVEIQMRCLREQVLPGLRTFGIEIVTYDQLDAAEQADFQTLFSEWIFPILTPLLVDPSHPFPIISNISLNLGILVIPENPRNGDGPRFARLKLPPNVPRLLPVVEGGTRFVLLEEVVTANIKALFPGMRILECQPFRITRDADIEIEEDEAGDLLKKIEERLQQRRFGFGVRLEVASGMSPQMVELLRHSLELEAQDVYTIDGPLNIPGLMALTRLDFPGLKDAPFTPATPPILRQHESILDAIRQQDILLHHPYDSFVPVVEFIRAAARDPQVLAIKQTLYRVGRDSPIVEALIEAARNGKQVAVLVELKARFDEENNILWARRMEEAGVHVVYGVVGLKTHAKIALVVRQEQGAIRRYIHLGTGNYNATTSRIYTDFGLLTADRELGADASELFNYLTGYSRQNRYRKLLVAPVSLRRGIVEMIRREVAHHRAGRPAGIIAMFNSLTDTGLVDELYTASREGVPIDLIVRGVCCLRPGLPGVSETIRVGSIVGRFLEHTRVYRFLNGGEEAIYLGSADLMNRNLDRRIEILFPLEDVRLRERLVEEVLVPALRDTAKMRWLESNGQYHRPHPSEESPFNLQKYLLPPARQEPARQEVE